MRIPPALGKLLYGVLFAAVLPFLLILWSRATAGAVRLPAFGRPWLGWLLAASGLILLAAGARALWIHGGGLPMNPFPPPRHVAWGIFRYLGHPIYTGFSLAVFGTAMAMESAGGLWLITPLAIAGCAALVWGYESHELVHRFGNAVPHPLISLPSADDGKPTPWARLFVYLLVLLPWLILYEMVVLRGMPADAIEVYFPFERSWPVLEWTEAVYASAYLQAILAPLLAQSNRRLRDFSIAGWFATILTGLIFFTIPLSAPPRPFEPGTWLGEVLKWEQSLDSPAAACPSFHVSWAFIAAPLYIQWKPELKILWWTWAALIAASCLTTGMHGIVDVLCGFLVALLALNLKALWRLLLCGTEWVANSWKERRIGRIRVINHGAFAALGSFTGLLIAGALSGAANLPYLLLVAFSGIIAAALWAQLIEGSPVLLRPFGYYGSVLGVILGAVLSWFLGADAWLLLAAFAVAGPWIQAWGRLRCLVQGCCHGKPAPEPAGIRYRHPRSRVVRLAKLEGVAVYPTQLYSILWNVAIGLLLARFWTAGLPHPFIGGMYLILAGLGRFVEESYRGEPQTPRVAGLPIYQWNAIASVVVGALATCARSSGAVPDPAFDWRVILAAAFFGLITWFAMGMDFPDSNRRFSRLV